ncbi:MAG: hypothetical protein HOV94_11465, partial [Saccharothrix sp.]|nr:hypothetical protein [Saccharothrix sp.]
RADQAADQARGRAGDADRAALEATAAVRAFEQDVVAPLQRSVTDAEAEARELAARLEQNTEHLRELGELTELQARLPQLKHDKDAAEADYTAARHDSDLLVKQATDCWSDHALRRLRACDPLVRTVSINPDDFSVTVNGAPFDAKAVAGNGLARITVSVLLALRDTAHDLTAMPVPNFLLVDGPFTGLGASPADQRTAAALLESLADVAGRTHPTAGPGQAVIACTELPRQHAATVHEIPTSLADGAIPGLPPRRHADS